MHGIPQVQQVWNLAYGPYWHWVSSMGINVKINFWNICDNANAKINIFVTHPVTSTNGNNKNYYHHLFKHEVSKNIINYFFSKIKTFGDSLFLTKICTIFIILHYITNSSFFHVFITITAFVTFQSLRKINNLI